MRDKNLKFIIDKEFIISYIDNQNPVNNLIIFSIIITQLISIRYGNLMVLMTLKVLLITGRSLRQGVGKEFGKGDEKYMESVSLCEISPKDLEAIGAKSGSNIRIKTQYGSVVVKAVSSESIKPGMIFIPYGPYSNILLGGDTNSSGMPTFKGVYAEIEPAIEERVLTIKELVEQYYSR